MLHYEWPVTVTDELRNAPHHLPAEAGAVRCSRSGACGCWASPMPTNPVLRLQASRQGDFHNRRRTASTSVSLKYLKTSLATFFRCARPSRMS